MQRDREPEARKQSALLSVVVEQCRRAVEGSHRPNLRRFPIKVLIPLSESPDTDFDRSLRLVADRFVQLGHIGKGRRHVSRLHRKKVELRLSAQTLLEHLDIAHQLDRLVVADVENTPGSIARRGTRVTPSTMSST